MQFRFGKLLKNVGKEEASGKLQEELEESIEQPTEDIILQINPASTKNENKLNRDAANGT